MYCSLDKGHASNLGAPTSLSSEFKIRTEDSSCLVVALRIWDYAECGLILLLHGCQKGTNSLAKGLNGNPKEGDLVSHRETDRFVWSLWSLLLLTVLLHRVISVTGLPPGHLYPQWTFHNLRDLKWSTTVSYLLWASTASYGSPSVSVFNCSDRDAEYISLFFHFHKKLLT